MSSVDVPEVVRGLRDGLQRNKRSRLFFNSMPNLAAHHSARPFAPWFSDTTNCRRPTANWFLRWD